MASLPDPLIVGASDIGLGYYGPERVNQVRELNPGLSKRWQFNGRGSSSGPTKKIMYKTRDLNPGPTKKSVCTITHAIAKYYPAYDHKN